MVHQDVFLKVPNKAAKQVAGDAAEEVMILEYGKYGLACRAEEKGLRVRGD